MNAFAKLALVIAGSVGAGVAFLSIASICLADPEAHRFDGLSTSDLWTTKPIRVDRAKQNYKRLPAVYSSYVTDAAKGTSPIEQPALASTKVPLVSAALSSSHMNWCTERYRSYEPANNTYRAFSGEKRTCVSPYLAQQPATEVKADQAEPPAQDGSTINRAAEAWCASRYQSYRADDNTYQPYDGPRQRCAPPSTIIASLEDSRY